MNNKFIKIMSTLILTAAPVLSSVACSSIDDETKKYSFQQNVFSSREEAVKQLKKVARKIKKDKISIIGLLLLHEISVDVSFEERLEYFRLKILEFIQEKFENPFNPPLVNNSKEKNRIIYEKIEKQFLKLKKKDILKNIMEYDKKINYLEKEQQNRSFIPSRLKEHKPMLKNHLTFCSKNKNKFFVVKTKQALEDKNSTFFRIKSPLSLFVQVFSRSIYQNPRYHRHLLLANEEREIKELLTILKLFEDKKIYFDSLDSLYLWVQEQENLFNIEYQMEYQDLSNILNGYNPWKKFLTIEDAIENEIVLYQNNNSES